MAGNHTPPDPQRRLESRPTRVSRLSFMSRWLQLPLSHVNASVLKVKLGTAIIGIASVDALTRFKPSP